jgi:hypothetical protein
VQPSQESSNGWRPPHITQEFGYPSNEEIVPNTKLDYRKTFLPRLGHVRAWFKGVEVEPKTSSSSSQEGTRSRAPCLPVTTGKGSLADGSTSQHLDISPRCYTDITPRLPKDRDELHQVASHPGANRRLRSIARQSVADGSVGDGGRQDDLDDEESFSDSSSSPSLERHPSSPPYHELAPSVLSDFEDGFEDLHTAPVRMVNSGGVPEEPDAVIQELDAANEVVADEASLQEQVRD